MMHVCEHIQENCSCSRKNNVLRLLQEYLQWGYLNSDLPDSLFDSWKCSLKTTKEGKCILISQGQCKYRRANGAFKEGGKKRCQHAFGGMKRLKHNPGRWSQNRCVDLIAVKFSIDLNFSTIIVSLHQQCVFHRHLVQCSCSFVSLGGWNTTKTSPQGGGVKMGPNQCNGCMLASSSVKVKHSTSNTLKMEIQHVTFWNVLPLDSVVSKYFEAAKNDGNVCYSEWKGVRNSEVHLTVIMLFQNCFL